MKQTTTILRPSLVIMAILGMAFVSATLTSCGVGNEDTPIAYPPDQLATDLGTLRGDYVANDREVLTGTLRGDYKISIADGATVMLSDVTINGGQNYETPWAGITCLGSATLILDGNNLVRSFYGTLPGIQPGPEGTTLTIRGEGKLTAFSRGAPCIGSGYAMDGDFICGDIRIEGGDITAECMNGGCAGIGSGMGGGQYISQCGNITISGGSITAKGGFDAAGIGSGFNSFSRCGNITITGGVVTATGRNGGTGIGTGTSSQCGNIMITGGTVKATGGECAAGIGCGDGSSHFKSICGDIAIGKGEGFVSVTATMGYKAFKPIGYSKNLYPWGDDNVSGHIYLFDGGDRWEFVHDKTYETIFTEDIHCGLMITVTSSDPENYPWDQDTWVITPAE